jgi:hypothetical protein
MIMANYAHPFALLNSFMTEKLRGRGFVPFTVMNKMLGLLSACVAKCVLMLKC